MRVQTPGSKSDFLCRFSNIVVVVVFRRCLFCATLCRFYECFIYFIFFVTCEYVMFQSSCMSFSTSSFSPYRCFILCRFYTCVVFHLVRVYLPTSCLFFELRCRLLFLGRYHHFSDWCHFQCIVVFVNICHFHYRMVFDNVCICSHFFDLSIVLFNFMYTFSICYSSVHAVFTF